MLNRRILRIKAMQALYGFYTTRESLKKVVRDELEETFTPNPLTHDMSDTEEIDANRKKALRLYDDNLDKKKLKADSAITEVVFEEVNNSIDSYYKEVKKEVTRTKKLMLSQTHEIQDDYFKFLLLPGEIKFIEKQDQDKQGTARINKNEPWQFNLQKNPVVDALNTCEELQREVTKKKLSWQDDIGVLRTWYKDIFKKDETFIEYQNIAAPTLEEHKSIVAYILKKLFFKNETIVEFWEQEDLRWSENSLILRSMLTKTIQDYDAEADEPIQLKTISINEEDDFEFFETIFDATIKEDEYLEGLIAQRTKNWDVSRLAQTDMIILKMAIAEMMHCRSIPVKVSINEYIEVCKQYSTPKSKQFVNGILDVLANQLTSEGVIKKSGRGLIDNK